MIIEFVTTLIDFYAVLIIVYVILGYFSEIRRTSLYSILHNICEPYLKIFEFATINMISFAPILAVLLLRFLNILIREIYL